MAVGIGGQGHYRRRESAGHRRRLGRRAPGCGGRAAAGASPQPGARNLVLSEPIISWFTDQFLPLHDREQRRDPDISPLFAELSAMPPAIFTVGTQDPLLDDTLFMEARWRTAGNATELRIWPEAPHGFISLPMTVADAALSAEHDFLRRTLHADPG